MKHRYPGPRSFTGDDSHLFFGRDTEKEELLRMIVLNDMVVLFGESGTGKTSLLQAGVCPLLEERQYKTVLVRLNRTEETPENQVFNALNDGGYLPADMPKGLSLGEYFSRFWYVDLGEVYSPVIVFDQFEEFFTLYTPDKRQAFIQQFAAMINRRLPETGAAISESLAKTKFVFSLRSDFLYLLDELSADIPAILRCRYQLKQLNEDSAREAIILPAKEPSGTYHSPAFGYSEDALKDIILGLTQKTAGSQGASTQLTVPSTGKFTDIAANLLQLVCSQIEERIIHSANKPGFDAEVKSSFFGGVKGLKNIIDEYYRKTIEKIELQYRDAVERLLARGLLNNGRRIMVEAESLLSKYAVPSGALEILYEERLLKRETRKRETYYEISHDTLIDPILNRFKRIEGIEAAQEAEKLRQQAKAEKDRADEAERLKNVAVEARNKANDAKKNAQKISYYAIGLAFLATLASLAAGWYYDQSKKDKEAAIIERDKALASDSIAKSALVKAESSDSIANKRKDEAEFALLQLKEEQRLKFLSDADAFRKDNLYDQALRAYENALKLSNTPSQLNDIRQNQALTRYEQNRAIGLALARTRECEAAKAFLRAALLYRRDDRQVLNALSECGGN